MLTGRRVIESIFTQPILVINIVFYNKHRYKTIKIKYKYWFIIFPQTQNRRNEITVPTINQH